MSPPPSQPQAPQQSPDTPARPRILPRQPVSTRDGVTLCTDVYLPATDPPMATVVVRTPYGRNLPMLLKLAVRLNQAGLAALIQDCRGRYQSAGRYDFLREPDDTYDTLAWMADQDWCDGRVALYGMSITSFPNYRVAAQPWPEGVEVQAMVSVMGMVDSHAMFYPSSALNLHWALPWVVMMGREEVGRTRWQNLDWDEVFRHLPLATAAETWAGGSKEWDLVLRTAVRDDTWKGLDASPELASLAVPTLHLSGWSDFMLDQTLAGYRALGGGNQPAAPQKLVVGPWDHRTLFTAWGGGDPRSRTDADLLELVAYWCARWLLPESLDLPGMEDFQAEGDVLLWLEGEERWLAPTIFPPSESESVEWFLAGNTEESARPPATGPSVGVLQRETPDSAGRHTFRYDPDDPVPTVGGSIWPFPAAGLEPGPADQSTLAARDDVLVFLGPVLERDLHLAGPVEVELWAATSARDTDFTAKLVEVDRLGVPRILQDGLCRGRFRESPEREALLEPHRPTRFKIPLGSLARRVAAGHRLALHVSSSNFPKFDRNLNTARPPAPATDSMVALQTVFHGAPMASKVRLSILPEGLSRALVSTTETPWRRS